MKLKYDKERQFKSFIDQVYPEPNTGCWIWGGIVNNSGYSNFTFNGLTMGHRFSYFYFKGDFDRKLLVCHSCDNRLCVNPDHLFLGTVADNNKDRDNKGRGIYPFGETHTNAKLTEENVIEIKRFIKAGIPMAQIARFYDVHKSKIWQIHHGKSWKHILNSTLN